MVAVAGGVAVVALAAVVAVVVDVAAVAVVVVVMAAGVSMSWYKSSNSSRLSSAATRAMVQACKAA